MLFLDGFAIKILMAGSRISIKKIVKQSDEPHFLL